jgi:hypothetical protein
MQQDWRGAIEAVDRSRAIAAEHRTGADAGIFHLMTRGEAYVGLGELTRGTSLMREAVELAERRGEHTNGAFANVSLARVLLAAEGLSARGEIEAALNRASDLVDGVGSFSMRPAIHAVLAELAHQAGDVATHERELREAHRLFVDIGASGHAEHAAAALAALGAQVR